MGKSLFFAVQSVAEAYLALLKARGVDRLYVNAGTDTPPIVEAYARAAESGLQLPGAQPPRRPVHQDPR